MPTLKLSTQSFYFGGHFKHHTQAELAELARQHRARTARVFRLRDVTCLVAGARSTADKNRARSRDIPIITEAQFMELLERGELEIDSEEFIATKFDLSRAIAELRSIFDGSPTSQTWTRCIEIIEQCDAAQEQELVAYIAPFLARWDNIEMTPWEPPKTHAMMSGVSAQMWSVAVCDPELRVAPPIWMLEMLRGEYSPKHELVRSVNLHHAKTNGGRMVKLLQNPYLTRMHTLVLGAKNSYSKTFFKTLCTHPNSRTIKTLYVDVHDEHAQKYFTSVMDTTTHQLTSLEQLYVCADFYYVKSTEPFRKLPPFEHIEIHLGYWPYSGKGWGQIHPDA